MKKNIYLLIIISIIVFFVLYKFLYNNCQTVSKEQNITNRNEFALSGELLENILTKKEVESLYQKAKEASSWFYFGSINLVPGNNTIEYNGHEYNKVMDERFYNLETLKLYLEKIFTRERIESLFSRFHGEIELFVDIEGELYILNGGSGTNLSVTNDRINFFEYNSNGTVTVEVLADKNDDDISVTQKYYYTLAYEEGDWKFSDFYPYNY